MRDYLGGERKNLNRLLEKHRSSKERILREKQELEEANSQIEATKKAQEALQEIARQIQHKAHKQVAKVVSRCLSATFDRKCELRVVFERRRGKTDARFIFLENGKRVEPKSTSGGLREVAGLALRVVRLVLSQPQLTRLLVLDEPFLALSQENKARMAVLLKSLSEELDLQIILVTHDQTLQTPGRVINLEEL
jgi:DNA repair exonuclease SbcCD ATPase subunit